MAVTPGWCRCHPWQHPVDELRTVHTGQAPDFGRCEFARICRPPIPPTVAINRYRKTVEGTQFGRYQLLERLGRGGMGEVWRAHDTTIDRVVAIKMLLPGVAEDPEFEKRFRREARAAARLDDPHVVPIHDVGEIDGRLYVTMQLINGVDLQTMLNDGPLDPPRAIHIVEQIASALHSAHQTGLVHRDVKPSNILVTPKDFAYLIDFGIARASGDTQLTSANATIGTWAYMAPERFQTGNADPSGDVYALACVLYQCLTGQLPFPGDTPEQLLHGHLVTPPPQPSGKRATISTAMDQVIATGLAKQPSGRYASTVEMATAARHAITEPVRQPYPAPHVNPSSTTYITPNPVPPVTPEPAPHFTPEAAPHFTPEPAPHFTTDPTLARPRPPGYPPPAAAHPPSPYSTPAGYGAPGYAFGAPTRKWNKLAFASLIVSPFFFLGAIPAIVLGIVALKQIKRSGQKGRGIAIAGVAIGALWLVVYAIALVWSAIR
jgi:serine/threonine protein kinase